jgi:CofD-related protein of GAK system
MTPFDSGGSSAKLREAFRMLAVGDLRNRLMALADRSVQGHHEVIDLFSFRFPINAETESLRVWLGRMVDGQDEMVRRIPDPMRKLVRSHLYFFFKRMPDDFDLRGANIGNLILAGGYLNYNRHIDPVVFLFSKLVEVKGMVRPISSEYVHLCAELENGNTIAGQHLMCAKEVPPIDSPIKQVFLSRSRIEVEACQVPVRDKVAEMILNSDLICYPMGSFYTSIIACILPQGVGSAVAQAEVPKVYVPNAGNDPEQLGMTVSESVHTLIRYLRESAGEAVPATSLINYVLLDPDRVGLPLGDMKEVAELGIQVVQLPLGSGKSNGIYDSENIVETLLSFT